MSEVPRLEAFQDHGTRLLVRDLGSTARHLAAVEPPTDKWPGRGDNAGEIMPQVSTVLESLPHLEAFWHQMGDEDDPKGVLHPPMRISGIGFENGGVLVNGPVGDPTPQFEKCAILASFGLQDEDIGKHLGVTMNTVNTHLNRFFAIHGTRQRETLPAYFVANKIYTIAQACTLPSATEIQLDIFRRIAHGKGNEAIGEECGLNRDKVAYQISRFMGRTGYTTRTQIAMATVLSGQVEF